MRPPLLQISATPEGVREVAIRCEGNVGLRLYGALLPAIDTINDAIRSVLGAPEESEVGGTADTSIAH